MRDGTCCLFSPCTISDIRVDATYDMVRTLVDAIYEENVTRAAPERAHMR
jgi:hypothetical protein